MSVVTIAGRDSSGRPVEVKVESGALTAAVANLFSREDPVHGQGTYDSGVQYEAGAGVTSDADITLGATGAAGDRLNRVRVRNGSASTMEVRVIDGTTVLEAFTTLAVAAGATVDLDIGGLISANGAWKIRITSAGTMSSIHYLAQGTFS